MPGITDLPGLQQTAEAFPLECRENAGGADVQCALESGVHAIGADIFLHIDVLFESAAADFSAIDEHPVGLAKLPVAGIEEIRDGEDFAIERHQAAELVRQDGFAEFHVHRVSG